MTDITVDSTGLSMNFFNIIICAMLMNKEAVYLPGMLLNTLVNFISS